MNLVDRESLPKTQSTQLNCFSPPVMVATLAVETVLAIYTLWRYKMNVLGRLVTMSLLALGLFQLCEYHVCGGMGLRASEWSRLGFASITLLPPLGLHILHVLSGKPNRKLVGIAYASMVGFVTYFLANPTAFQGYQCTGNYVIFQIGIVPSLFYAAYYYGWLFTGIGLGFRWVHQLKTKKSELAQKRLQTSRALIIGYLVFLVPTALANSVNPETRRGIPSIMCGFAVLFALILTLYVLPKLGTARLSDEAENLKLRHG